MSIVEKVEFKEFISGPDSPSHTLQWEVNGTDLGIPCYSEKEDKLWLFFGDTFASPFNTQALNWRGTVIGKVSDYSADGHLIIDEFVSDEKGLAKNLITHHKRKSAERYEVTKISQGAIEINGVMYTFYESIRSWGEPGFWDVNYSGALKSTDGGNTWERVYDLTWADLDQEEYTAQTKMLAEQDIALKASGVDINIEKHNAPAFGQIYPVDGKDGYIYIYGRRGGRQFGITVGRVKAEEFENFDAYEYLTDAEAGTWIKGAAGLKALSKNEEKARIIPAPTSNMTVAYNPYFQKWMLVYFKPGTGIVVCFADTPYGKFGEANVVLSSDRELPKGKGFYGAFTHELMLREKGKKMLLIVSQWTKLFYGSELFEVTFS